MSALVPKLVRLMLDPAAPDGEVLNAALALRKSLGDGDKIGRLRQQLVIDHESGVLRFPFGRHEGMTLEEIIRVNPGYLPWCLQNMRRMSPQLRHAIETALKRVKTTATH